MNDTYGHDAGDIVLCETARRLLSIVRTADVVARLGGDEFVVVFEPDLAGPEDLIRRINEALAVPVAINEGGVGGTITFLIILIALTMGVMFINAKRSHLD